MNKSELYKKANEEIKIDEKLKRTTKNKALEPKKKHKIFLNVANVVTVAVVFFCVMWIMQNQNNNNAINNNIMIATTKKLPTVNTVENFKTLLKETQRVNASYDMEKNQAESMITDATNTTESKEWSSTNIQVEGVDESDTVKTDGNYLYYVKSSKVIIADCRETLKMVKEIEYDNNFYPSEIFLTKNKLVVMGNKNSSVYHTKSSQVINYDIAYMPSEKTKVIVYDITNKENITVTREYEVDGNEISARMIKDDLYLITNKHFYISTLQEKIDENEIKPEYQDSILGEEAKKINLNEICYFPNNVDESSYLIISSFNVEENQKANVQTFLGAGSTIYCSESNLYITKYKYDYSIFDEAKNVVGINTNNESTQIFKFELKNGVAEYKAEGNVLGTIINQFAMDENNGYFRIATTVYSSGWNENKEYNNLYILNSSLNVVGKIEEIAKGERIYSVRFMGDRAYMVTFKQTDPLFVIDVSTPTNPKILGKLKIPGFSKYLHPYSENYIIGFGQDTEEVNYGYGDVTTTAGMKMALFDVTDVENPKEMCNVKIGDKGTYSELLYNHKALLFSKEKNIIAFPISIVEGNNYKITYQGAIVYGLDLEKGFYERGRIANGEVNYDYGNRVSRILYVKDTLYTFSENLIKGTDLNTMQELSKLEMED